MSEDLTMFGGENVRKAATEAFGSFLEKLATKGTDISSSLNSSMQDDRPDGNQERPKSWFLDPFYLMDNLGLGYRATPASLTFDTLRVISEKDTIIAAIHARRIAQISSFSRRQVNKYSIGHEVHLRGRHRGRKLTPSEQDKIDYIEAFIQHTGREPNLETDNFTDFLKKFIRDSLTLDAGVFEKTRTYGGDPYAFFALDGATIRFAEPDTPQGTPPTVADLKSHIRYTQVIGSQPWRDYTSDQLAYIVRNPRTNLRVYRYGLPEIEILINTITSHLLAEQYNRNTFVNGSFIRGIINFEGRVNPEQVVALQRDWQAKFNGSANANRLPVVSGPKMNFVPMQMNNQEMGYQAWVEYLIKVTCSVYNIDPAEIQFDLRGGIGQQPMFMSSNEAQQKISRDQGLVPLLRTVEDAINRHVVYQIDPRFEFSFVGIDAKTEEQNYELRSQQVQTTHTLNEARALEGLDPVPNGDVVLNPVYIGYVQAKDQAAQMAQQAQQPAPGGDGGDEPPPTEEDRAFFSKPGEEERQAASRLMQLQGGQPAKPEQQEATEFDRLFQDDWTSTVNSALPSADLKKSSYEVFSLDDF